MKISNQFGQGFFAAIFMVSIMIVSFYHADSSHVIWIIAGTVSFIATISFMLVDDQ